MLVLIPAASNFCCLPLVVLLTSLNPDERSSLIGTPILMFSGSISVDEVDSESLEDAFLDTPLPLSFDKAAVEDDDEEEVVAKLGKGMSMSSSISTEVPEDTLRSKAFVSFREDASRSFNWDIVSVGSALTYTVTVLYFKRRVTGMVSLAELYVDMLVWISKAKGQAAYHCDIYIYIYILIIEWIKRLVDLEIVSSQC